LVSDIREEHRQRAFKNRVLRAIFGPKGKETGENYIMRSFITCAFRQKLLG
jgi:hypothetical protein